MSPVTGTGCTSVDIGVNANLQLLVKFCYLCDMLSVDGDAGAAVETRIWNGWNKFRQLVPMLTNKDISLIAGGRLYRREIVEKDCQARGLNGEDAMDHIRWMKQIRD